MAVLEIVSKTTDKFEVADLKYPKTLRPLDGETITIYLFQWSVKLATSLLLKIEKTLSVNNCTEKHSLHLSNLKFDQSYWDRTFLYQISATSSSVVTVIKKDDLITLDWEDKLKNGEDAQDSYTRREIQTNKKNAFLITSLEASMN